MAARTIRPEWHFLIVLGVIVTATTLAAVLILPRGRIIARWSEMAMASELLSTSDTVEAPSTDWFAWSLYDLDKGYRIGSPNAGTETNNTESMIKAWIGADFVAEVEHENRELSPGERDLVRDMIRASDDEAAEILYQNRGGDAVIERLVSDCGLTRTSVSSGRWSYTRITADDAVTMLACVMDRAGDSPLTGWLLDEMRQVEPSNAFGIPQALPAGTPVAVKNGWTLQSYENLWYVNCLATWGHWVLSVLTRYPGKLGQEHGAWMCADVTRQLLSQGFG